MSIQTLVKAWNDYFFKPVSPLPIALYRIGYGCVLIGFCILIAPDVPDFFGKNAILSLETSREWGDSERLNVFSLLAETDNSAWLVFGALLFSSITLTVGLYTRASAAAIFVLIVSLIHRNPAVFNGSETVMKVMAFHLMFSHAGATLSLDRWLRVQEGSEGPEVPFKPPWAQRMMQIQYTIIYFVTCSWKLRGTHWIDGTALYYASNLAEYWRYPVPYLFDHLWTVKLLTWGTLLIEFALGTLLWIKELRYPILVAGVLLHLGIEYTMVVPFFSWVMIIGYINFIDPNHLKGLIFAITRTASRVVVGISNLKMKAEKTQL